MENSRSLMEKHRLPNGLEVHFYDNSRKIAGDRWYVQLQVEIPIPLDDELLDSLSDEHESLEEFINEQGNPYVYRYIKERNFIDENDRLQVLEELKKDFVETNWNYLSHPRFARLALKKALGEWEERRRWWR